MYEFSASENEIIIKLANRISFFAIILLIVAIVDFISELRSGANLVDLLSLPIILSVMAISLFFPARNFRNVVATEGNDIQELVTGFRRLSVGLNLVIIPALFLPVVVVATFFNG